MKGRIIYRGSGVLNTGTIQISLPGHIQGTGFFFVKVIGTN
ncbi:MAG: hypothetical protein ACLFUC_10300 [Bacteroidales bacterium]